jgi:hypothetical protein
MIYTGIGSRTTPHKIQANMELIATILGHARCVLRSGGAEGADKAFERGCDAIGGEKEIYLPWRNFNNNPSPLFDIPNLAYELAADVYGPSWKHIKRTTKMFMARNTQQVLGKNLDSPTDFVVCWTKDGCNSRSTRTSKTGGTGQAIALASDLNIPIFNLNVDYRALAEFLGDKIL